jgi:UDP-N-acetylglucosamine 2-epimerase
VDNSVNLQEIALSLNQLPFPVVLPIHPRTRKQAITFGIESLLATASNLRVIEPVGYLEMIALQKHARVILTDSGGIQKEAYLLKVPCVTLRPETEWVETVEAGWNRLANIQHQEIVQLVQMSIKPQEHPNFYGDGQSALYIRNILSTSV